MNQITHWLDGSNIYGSNNEEAYRLRKGESGQLKLSSGNRLPLDEEGIDVGCKTARPGGMCFISGDDCSSFGTHASSLFE